MSDTKAEKFFNDKIAGDHEFGELNADMEGQLHVLLNQIDKIFGADPNLDQFMSPIELETIFDNPHGPTPALKPVLADYIQAHIDSSRSADPQNAINDLRAEMVKQGVIEPTLEPTLTENYNAVASVGAEVLQPSAPENNATDGASWVQEAAKENAGQFRNMDDIRAALEPAAEEEAKRVMASQERDFSYEVNAAETLMQQAIDSFDQAEANGGAGAQDYANLQMFALQAIQVLEASGVDAKDVARVNPLNRDYIKIDIDELDETTAPLKDELLKIADRLDKGAVADLENKLQSAIGEFDEAIEANGSTELADVISLHQSAFLAIHAIELTRVNFDGIMYGSIYKPGDIRFNIDNLTEATIQLKDEFEAIEERVDLDGLTPLYEAPTM
ncbi:MAG: hypothetical protein AAF204_02315 [Pseudomonadota bacterium]